MLEKKSILGPQLTTVTIKRTIINILMFYLTCEWYYLLGFYKGIWNGLNGERRRQFKSPIDSIGGFHHLYVSFEIHLFNLNLQLIQSVDSIFG